MADVPWADLLVVLSLMTGTGALTLCLLTWNILRRSVVGKTVVVLTFVLGLFDVYHGLVLLVPESRLATSLLKSVSLSGVALFIAMSIRMQSRIGGDDTRGGDR